MGSAVELVGQYYHAINQHSAAGMLDCVEDAVEVSFAEAERNWAGRALAEDKFAGWFARCPDVRATWAVDTANVGADGSVELALDCTFTPESRHGMGYIVSTNGKIQSIK